MEQNMPWRALNREHDLEQSPAKEQSAEEMAKRLLELMAEAHASLDLMSPKDSPASGETPMPAPNGLLGALRMAQESAWVLVKDIREVAQRVGRL